MLSQMARFHSLLWLSSVLLCIYTISSFFFFLQECKIYLVLGWVGKFFFDWSMINLQHYISFRYTTYWFNIFVHYKMNPTISLLTICHHTKLLQYYWLYSLCYTLHLWDLFYNWEFVLLNPLHLFCPHPHPHTLWWLPVTFLYLQVFLVCYACSFVF